MLCHCFQMSNCGVKVRDLSSVVILFANKFGGLNVFYFILFFYSSFLIAVSWVVSQVRKLFERRCIWVIRKKPVRFLSCEREGERERVEVFIWHEITESSEFSLLFLLSPNLTLSLSWFVTVQIQIHTYFTSLQKMSVCLMFFFSQPNLSHTLGWCSHFKLPITAPLTVLTTTL